MHNSVSKRWDMRVSISITETIDFSVQSGALSLQWTLALVGLVHAILNSFIIIRTITHIHNNNILIIST